MTQDLQSQDSGWPPAHVDMSASLPLLPIRPPSLPVKAAHKDGRVLCSSQQTSSNAGMSLLHTADYAKETALHEFLLTCQIRLPTRQSGVWL